MYKGIQNDIYKLFVDSSNRPKKTPRHESSIQIALERKYAPGQVKNTLNILEENGTLQSKKYHIEQVGDAKFYFSSKLSKENISSIDAKIKKSAQWISKYSRIKTIKMLRDHLHYLVKAELRTQGFEIITEKHVRRFKEKEWTRSRHTLDILAVHKTKELPIGVEIKNMLTPISKAEIMLKLEMCEKLGIYPIFACRYQEYHRKEIENSSGFLWQFKTQLYPFGQEVIVKELQKRFNFPVEVKGELPLEAIKDFEIWKNKYK